jgi:preprotein translocase subunit SecE
MADSKGINPARFAAEVRQEARKVTWTTWRETLITTIMVFVMVTLAGLFLFLVDLLLNQIVTFALGLGGA